MTATYVRETHPALPCDGWGRWCPVHKVQTGAVTVTTERRADRGWGYAVAVTLDCGCEVRP